MFPEPEYAQNIIVGVIFHDIFAWYITEKDYWYLDYTKYDRALLASGYTKSSMDASSYRFGITILNEETSDRFLSAIADQRVPANMLSHMMEVRKEADAQNDLLDYVPCFLVDFDRRYFFSLYPEMIRFELYVPDNWIGTYKDFRSEIPEEEGYWIVNGYDIFKRE